MDDLQVLVESYLVSAQYNITNSREGFVVADKLILGGDRDTRLHWVPPPPIQVDNFEVLEDRLINEFETILPQYPDAKYFMVVHTTEGFSRSFISEITKRRIKMRVPINFFDAPYRSEENPKAITTINPLRDAALSMQRVPQPYSIIENDYPEIGGDDLITTLLDDLLQQQKPRLQIIVGPAGSGKTVLFNALFSRFYDNFLNKKRRREIFPRPIPFVPEHLRRVSSMRVQELINNFLQTDIAASLEFETFEWMLINGFSVWLFDGLEELYSGDPDFFDYILDLITREDNKARILICVRNSLLKTSDNLIRFLSEFGSKDPICLYKLDDWDHGSKRIFAWINLENRTPEKNENDTQPVTQFFSELNKFDSLKLLSGLPYYCKLLLNEFMYGKLKHIQTDFELIEYSISTIIKREIDKKLLSLDQLEAGGLDEWLETIALESYEQDFKGLTKSEIEEWAYPIIRSELSSEEFNNIITTLIQFPLFDAGKEPGLIAFKHELIVECLVGRYVAKIINKNPIPAAHILGRKADFADTLLARYLTEYLKEEKESIYIIAETLRSGLIHGRAFANLLQIFLFSSPDRDVIKSNNINLEGRDLSHLQFIYKDLAGGSFRNCNLSNTVFQNCDLRDCFFEGSHLSGTIFEKISEKELKGANFGDLNQFEFIFWNKNRIDEFKKMVDWITKTTERPENINEPCPTTLQLKKLFIKFINPDGSARRNDVPENAILRGKKIPSAPSLQNCVKACIKFGYLQGPDFRKRIKRSPGDKYGDMVSFVRNMHITGEMRQLLNALCPIDGCMHTL